MFPGHVSFAHSLSPFQAIGDLTLAVRAPENMLLKIETHQLESLPDAVDDGFITRRWRYRNPEPRTWDESRDAGIWRTGENPVLIVSNFESYAEIAEAYGKRALPKAEPTDRIRQLAAEIVGTESARREQARRLYEWVSEKISYAGNCIGIGAVVPRDLDVVLDNKRGDCKDHATLLQALLAAQGIASEQVLLNSGGIYDLPETPSVEWVNHVMNYLPEWRLYADATTRNIPFGHLPDGSFGKPVIHVGSPDAVRIIPANEAPVKEFEWHTMIRLAADGSAKGESRLKIRGEPAAAARAAFMDMKEEQREKFVERMLRGDGLRGKGALVLGDLAPEKRLSDEFEYGWTFEIENYLRGQSGAFLLDSMILPFLGGGNDRTQTRDVACSNFKGRETYDIVLEPGVRLTQLPESLTRKTPYLDYTAKVRRSARGVRLERVLVDKMVPGICKPEFTNPWQKEALKIAENLQQQVLFKRGKATK
jgi:hypothetical protein